MEPSEDILAVIVVYRPDVPLLERAVGAVAPQVGRLLVVVNDDGHWVCAMPPNATVLRSHANIGLGAAYNLAANQAREWGATHLLLLDQDSVAAPDMVDKLARALSSDKGAAAAGPLWRDSRSGQDGFFVRLSRYGAQRVPLQSTLQDHAPVEVDFLISSGSLISLAAIAETGPFDEFLFIEHVDTDWSLRARARNLRLYGVPAARLDHSLGERTHATFLGRRAFIHAPLRQYYLVRNAVLLWRRPHAPWKWILHDVRRTALLMSYYLIFHTPRLERLKCMIRGVRDGLFNSAETESAQVRDCGGRGTKINA